MKIEIWTIGKGNAPYIEQGIANFLNRLQPYCKTEFIIIPPPKRSKNTEVQQSLLMEEEMILSRLDASRHYLILLDEVGKEATSKRWAQQFIDLQNQGHHTVVLLIGGPWGVSELIKQKAKQIWSLSKLTFPHQLVRLILVEQLYRAFSIIHHSGYHHE